MRIIKSIKGPVLSRNNYFSTAVPGRTHNRFAKSGHRTRHMIGMSIIVYKGRRYRGIKKLCNRLIEYFVPPQ